MWVVKSWPSGRSGPSYVMDLVKAEALLDIESHALRKRQLGSIAYRVGGPAHVGLPAVGARLAPSSGLFFAAECPADLGSGGADVDVGDAAVRSRRRQETLGLAQIEREDRGGKPGPDRIVHPDRLVELGISHDIKNRRKGFPQHGAGLVRHFTQHGTHVVGVVAPFDALAALDIPAGGARFGQRPLHAFKSRAVDERSDQGIRVAR